MRLRISHVRNCVRMVLGVVLAGTVGTPAVLAFQGASDFVPVDQAANHDSVPGGELLVAAYAFAWIAIAIYLFALWRRSSKLERELAELNARLRAEVRST